MSRTGGVDGTGADPGAGYARPGYVSTTGAEDAGSSPGQGVGHSLPRYQQADSALTYMAGDAEFDSDSEVLYNLGLKALCFDTFCAQ